MSEPYSESSSRVPNRSKNATSKSLKKLKLKDQNTKVSLIPVKQTNKKMYFLYTSSSKCGR